MTDLPRLDPETVADALTDPARPRPAVAGVLLAGGTSSRFGEANKLLADLDGDPLVRHAARTLLAADLDEVVVVLGHEAAAVREALADLDVRFVDNPDYEAGLSTSVARGVEAAATADAALFLPGDMPAVDPSTVEALVDAYRAGLATALAAAYGERRGNPVLFDGRHFDALRDVDGDVGGRRVLLDGDRSALVVTDDPGVVADVDTVADLRRRR
ncbi:MAG: NTP transferase domain-containing protein [Haloarculaceae archaeon]